MSKKTTILLIDDHPLAREGLKAIISHHPDFAVIGEAGNGGEGIRQAKELRPDIAVVDISLPDMSGIQVTGTLRSLLPGIRILIVSMHAKMNYITEAFQAGAIGFVSKESVTEGLIQGLESVSRGQYYLDSSVSHQVVKNLLEKPEKEAKITDASYRALTPREREILRFLAEGHTVKEIAEQLFISPKTVETHRSNIMTKLDLSSTLDLARYAAKLGLIDVDLWKE